MFGGERRGVLIIQEPTSRRSFFSYQPKNSRALLEAIGVPESFVDLEQKNLSDSGRADAS